MAEELHHLQPEEIEGPEKGRHHRFVLKDGTQEIGFAEVFYYGKPVPLYYVMNLQVLGEKGKGKGSTIMNAVEQMLIERGKMGLLEDGIAKSSPARGMYARRGWQNIPGAKGWYVFNQPKAFDLARLADIPTRFKSPTILAIIARLRKSQP